jgi:hypothetical protein
VVRFTNFTEKMRPSVAVSISAAAAAVIFLTLTPFALAALLTAYGNSKAKSVRKQVKIP